MLNQHPRFTFGLLSVALALVPLVSSVGGASAQAAANATGCPYTPKFDRGEFSSPTHIDNKWLPLAPGMQFTLEGRATRGNTPLPHQVILTVTDVTKVIDGVKTVVLWDVDQQDGKPQEAELAFHAQDDRANVWMLGEYPEEYDTSGKFVGAPNVWIAGLNRTLPGWAMIAEPELGTPRYLQASSPPIDFLDCAQVFAVDQDVCVPARCYDNVMITDETSPLASGRAHQRKYYAPGVGNVKITAIDDPEAETLVLISVKHLGPAAMTHARNEALRLDRHGRQVSALYRRTPPAQ